MVHLARLARLHRQPDLGAGLQAHQMVMHARHRQQRRDRHIVGIGAAVGEDNHIVVGGDGRIDLVEELLHRLVEAGLAVCALEQDRNGVGLVAEEVDFAQLLELGVFEDRPL